MRQVSIRLHLGAWGGGGMFDAAAWASTGLQYTAAGSMTQTNLTNVTAAHVDLSLNNGMAPHRCCCCCSLTRVLCRIIGRRGDIRCRSSCISGRIAVITRNHCQRCRRRRGHRRSERLCLQDLQAATSSRPCSGGGGGGDCAADGAQRVSVCRERRICVLVTGFEQRCSLQARLPRVCCCRMRSHGAGVGGRRLCRAAGRVHAAASGDEPAVVLVVSRRG